MELKKQLEDRIFDMEKVAIAFERQGKTGGRQGDVSRPLKNDVIQCN